MNERVRSEAFLLPLQCLESKQVVDLHYRQSQQTVPMYWHVQEKKEDRLYLSRDAHWFIILKCAKLLVLNSLYTFYASLPVFILRASLMYTIEKIVKFVFLSSFASCRQLFADHMYRAPTVVAQAVSSPFVTPPFSYRVCLLTPMRSLITCCFTLLVGTSPPLYQYRTGLLKNLISCA